MNKKFLMFAAVASLGLAACTESSPVEEDTSNVEVVADDAGDEDTTVVVTEEKAADED